MGLLSILRKDQELELTSTNGDIKTFDNPTANPEVFVNAKTFATLGGLNTLEELQAVENFELSKNNIIFLQQFLDPPLAREALDMSEGLITANGNSLTDLAPSFINPNQYIAPAKYTGAADPNLSWVPASIYEPLHGEWHKVLRDELKIKNWDFDYGQGLVYSHTEGKGISPMIRLDLAAPEETEYKLLLRTFSNVAGGIISYSLDEQEKKEIDCLGQANRFVWQEIDVGQLKPGPHSLALKNLGGFNAINLVALVPTEDYRTAMTEAGEIWQNKHVISTRSISARDLLEEFSLETSENADYQASFLCASGRCHDSLSTATVNGVTPEKNSIVESVENVPISIGISPRSDHLAIDFPGLRDHNLLQNPKFEPLDPEGVGIKESGKVAWFSIEPDKNGGRRRLISTDPIPVTPNSTYYLQLNISLDQLAGLSVRSLQFHGEEELVSRKAIVADSFPTKLSGTNENVPLTIPINVRNGVNFVKIELTVEQNSETSSNLIINDMILLSGQDVDGIIDSVAAVSTNLDITNEQLPVQFEKVSSTLYRANVDAPGPWLLSFAKSFDPLWKAKSDEDKLAHLPNYGILNGFIATEARNDVVVIEYQPRTWFNIGVLVSIASIAACFGISLIWLLRRRQTK